MKTHEKIRNLREQKKMTQEEIADKLAISTSTYSKWERNETRLKVEQLQQIADILEVNIQDLLPDTNTISIDTMTDNSTVNQCSITQYCSITQNFNNQNEIEKLQLIIQHKDEIILQKDKLLTQLEKDNERLQKLLDTLTEKLMK